MGQRLPSPVGSEPIYCFWSDRLGRHSYAAGESEKQRLADNSAQGWTSEGIAWYAFDQASNWGMME